MGMKGKWLQLIFYENISAWMKSKGYKDCESFSMSGKIYCICFYNWQLSRGGGGTNPRPEKKRGKGQIEHQQNNRRTKNRQSKIYNLENARVRGRPPGARQCRGQFSFYPLRVRSSLPPRAACRGLIGWEEGHLEQQEAPIDTRQALAIQGVSLSSGRARNNSRACHAVCDPVIDEALRGDAGDITEHGAILDFRLLSQSVFLFSWCPGWRTHLRLVHWVKLLSRLSLAEREPHTSITSYRGGCTWTSPRDIKSLNSPSTMRTPPPLAVYVPGHETAILNTRHPSWHS